MDEPLRRTGSFGDRPGAARDQGKRAVTTVVRPAAPEDRDRIVADLRAAFFEDPVQRWVFPDPRRRDRYGRHLSSASTTCRAARS